MLRHDGRAGIEVSDGSCHLDDAIMGARRQIDLMKRCFQQILGILLQCAVSFDHAVVHLSITKEDVPPRPAAESRQMAQLSGYYADLYTLHETHEYEDQCGPAADRTTAARSA